MVTWNPLDKSDNVVLSSDNMTAGLNGTVRATEGLSSGKWYFECKCNRMEGPFGWHGDIGVGTLAASLNNYVGENNYSYSYVANNGQKYGKLVSDGSWGRHSFAASYTTNDVIGTAIDVDAGKIWWSKNGVWQGNGDPVSGAVPAFSSLIGTFYPMASSMLSVNSVTLLSAAHLFNYDVPYGFSPLNHSYAFYGSTKTKAGEDIILSDGVDVYFYRRDTGALMGHTVSDASGGFEFMTTYGGEHFIVALDKDDVPSYNDVVVGKVTPHFIL